MDQQQQKRRRLSRFLVAPLFLALLALTTNGCGGGHGTSTTTPGATAATSRQAQGSVQFTIHWPARAAVSGRLVPEAANSIHFVVATNDLPEGPAIVKETTVPRPLGNTTSVITLDGLPELNLTISAAAYPSADGSGVAQASGATEVALSTDTPTANASLTLQSTIAYLDIAPAIPSVSEGQTVTLQAAARDTSGSTVLTATNAMQWSSSSPTVATVNPQTGAVTGIKQGTTTISVLEPESKKTNAVQITVGGVTDHLAITSTSFSVDVGQTTQLTVTRQDKYNVAVSGGTFTWASANPNVAAIDAKTGLVTGVADGQTVITVTDSDSGKSQTTTVYSKVYDGEWDGTIDDLQNVANPSTLRFYLTEDNQGKITGNIVQLYTSIDVAGTATGNAIHFTGSGYNVTSTYIGTLTNDPVNGPTISGTLASFLTSNPTDPVYGNTTFTVSRPGAPLKVGLTLSAGTNSSKTTGSVSLTVAGKTVTLSSLTSSPANLLLNLKPGKYPYEMDYSTSGYATFGAVCGNTTGFDSFIPSSPNASISSFYGASFSATVQKADSGKVTGILIVSATPYYTPID